MARNKSEQDKSEKLRTWALACPAIDLDEGYVIEIKISTSTGMHILQYATNETIVQETHISHGEK